MIPPLLGFAVLSCSSAVHATELPVVPKWERFEITLKSRATYTNAAQEAEVRALLVSPLGETNRVYGFWDGGKTWRVRFAPNFPGRWRYYTLCSDTANTGLNGQTGEFLCSAPLGNSRFGEHGPIQVARDEEHLEHADHTPFLWLGDAAWEAPARAAASDWAYYANQRAAQKFNVVQWRLPLARAEAASGAFTGWQRITLNPDFFKKLDIQVEETARAGLLSAIAPLWEIGPGAESPLPEDQAIVLLRYAVARWGAGPVAWIVAFESDSTGAQAARWQRIGRAVFNPVAHGPVVLLPGDAPWVLPDFRAEPWVGAIGFQTTQVINEDTLPWLLRGPMALERSKLPDRPLITLAPAAETAATGQVTLRTSDFVRRVLWWSLLINSPAGVSYSAKDIAEWTTNDRNREQPWRAALALPGGSAVAPLAECLTPVEFWRLRPFSKAGIVPSDTSSPGNQIVAVRHEAGDLMLFYVPEGNAVTLPLDNRSAATNAVWLNPRTGDRRPAVAAGATPLGCQFMPPNTEDGVLIVKPTK